MSKFVVVVFPNEAQAYQGTRAFMDLHAEGSITLYGMAVVAKDAEGKFAIKESADVGPIGTAVGAFVGGLVGVIGGPAGALVGMAGGSAMGSLLDLFNFGVSADFVTKVAKELGPSKAAVVSEIGESWTTPLDTRMELLGGTLLRTWRADFEDEQIANEAVTSKAEWEQLRAEYAQAGAETKAKVKAKVDQAKAGLEKAQERVRSKLDASEKELTAKVAALEQQISNARADAKDKVRQRIATMRTEHATRSGKLKQAWALTKEALAA